MHKLKLIYAQSKSQHYKEAMTHAATIQLYTQLGVECYQCSASCIIFANSRDLTLASLTLSNSTVYTPEVVVKDSLNSKT